MKRVSFIVCLLLFTCSSFAQTRNFKVVKTPTSNPTNQQRKAVVIGMSDYGEGHSLNNTLKDADDMADVLTRLGFVVTILKNNNLRNLQTNLNNWYKSIELNDIAFFFFAGHGVEVNGTNYLIPIEAELQSQSDVEYNTLNVNWVLGKMNDRKVGMKLIILDACRDNPFVRSWTRGSSSTGLASMTAPPSTYIAFAAAPGAVAEDGGNLGNGVFTHFLKQEISKPNVPIDIIFTNVAKGVCDYTENRQRPFRTSDLTDLFYFIPPSYTHSQPSTRQEYIPPAQSYMPVNNRFTNYTETANGLNLEMVAVRGGTFVMGSTGEHGIGYYDEIPAHKVAVSDFYIGKFEVTQKQWVGIMGANPSFFKGDYLPVESVSWFEIQVFIRRLNEVTGKNYRLPTEAEWEYAARGGTQSQGCMYSGSNNLYNVAWFKDNSADCTHPIGSKKSNELGIYDMSGNVSEWCSDLYGSYSVSEQQNPKGSSSGSSRVCRGGSWYNPSKNLSVSSRDSNKPDDYYSIIGFRLACSSN